MQSLRFILFYVEISMGKWFELTLKASDLLTPENLDDAFAEVGALAVTMKDAGDDPIYEPPIGTVPLWRETLVTGLFAMPCDVESIKARLSRFLDEPFLPIVALKELEDQDWVGAWKEHYKPIKFGENLWVCPTHLSPPEPDVATLMLDPGLAFGTGTHPTTALCLEWLSENKVLFENKSVIDYGCGSGILGIAAKLLGAQACYSVDIDPQAIEATKINAKRNFVAIEPVLPEFFQAPPVEVVLANILSEPLIELAPFLTNYVNPGGHLILAGLLDHDIARVQAAYEKDFDFVEPEVCEGWARLCGVKKNG